jgi:DNA-binding transcriptional LysR family regulator
MLSSVFFLIMGYQVSLIVLLQTQMTLNQFLTFAIIAKHRNLSHASVELHASQSSITQKMKHLEREFGIKLYQKGQRGIVLTEDGEAFLIHAKAILKEVQKLTDQFLPPQSSKEPKVLRVGGSFAPSASFLPRILAELQKRALTNFKWVDWRHGD